MNFAVGARRYWLVAVVITAAALAQSSAKRPITHADYSSWRTINNQRLSPDGRFLLYTAEDSNGVNLMLLNVATLDTFMALSRPVVGL